MLDPLSPPIGNVQRSFFHYAVVHALYDYRTLLFFFKIYYLAEKKTQFFSLSLSFKSF